jgi:hypothetical protein
VKRGRYEYREFLWPGSVVDELYDVAEELMEAFDWPSRDAAMLFVLTGEAPMVQPVEARWERKQGTHLNPQWRIQLTIPPWLPESEVLGAYRQMRRQISGAKNLPKKTTPLEVARFVWKREREEGYKKRSWAERREQWGDEHPGNKFKTYNHFRTYFMRGAEAVKRLNFSWPRPSGKKAGADGSVLQ